MFSSRLHWDLRPNRLASLVEQKRRAGLAIIDLTESNPTRAGFSYPAGVLQAFADPRSLVYEPSPCGLPRAREAVAGYYAARGYSVDPGRILLTASTSEAYSYLFKLLADPGDEILVPQPSYPLFGYLAAAESVRAVAYALEYHGRECGWAIDFDALSAALTSRTRAVVLVSPNNPTGSFLKKDERERLIDLCAERRVAMVCDEVFADYTFAPDPRRVATLVDAQQVLTFCLSGLSKIAGLPQMKLGWIVLGGPSPLREQAGERLELIADTYLSVGTPVQHALPQLIESGKAVREQIAARVRGNLAFLQSTIAADSPCRALKAEGGWYAVLRVPRTRTEETWCLELLDRQGVLVQPGFFYDFESEAFLILSLLPAPETFQEGALRLLSHIGTG